MGGGVFFVIHVPGGHFGLIVLRHRPACFVNNEAPRAATDLSIAVTVSIFRGCQDFGHAEARFSLFLCFFAQTLLLRVKQDDFLQKQKKEVRTKSDLSYRFWPASRPASQLAVKTK